MKVDREQAEQAHAEGRAVVFLAPDAPSRRVEKKKDFPPADAEGEYLLPYDERGNLTRAGMELALRERGSVMLDGRVIESKDDLPDEVTLVRGNERATKALAGSLDAQIAALSAQRQRLDEGRQDQAQAVKAAEKAKAQRERQEAEQAAQAQDFSVAGPTAETPEPPKHGRAQHKNGE
jgi:hypothetical protein